MIKICLRCGAEFYPNSNSQKNCVSCRKFICKYCGLEFDITGGKWNRKICSNACRSNFLMGKYPVNLKGKRGTRPRTAHLKNKPKHDGVLYSEWRMSVFKRDNFACVKCGKTSNELKKIGIKICADHIKPFCNYPELRYELSNGRTLCATCHQQTETYGYKARFF